MSEKTNQQSTMVNTSSYEPIRVPILKVNEYFTWKVKLTIISRQDQQWTANQIFRDKPEEVIPKEKNDYIEDLSLNMKDSKVRHL